jgi:hypothetical protein
MALSTLLLASILSAQITGSGTTNYVPLWTSSTNLGNSVLFQSGSKVGIGTITPAVKLDVNGHMNVRNTLNLFPAGAANTLAVSGTAFSISNIGKVTFVAGQVFPGTGTVTSVGSGAGLTGGPITNSGTLSIAAGGVTNAMLQHSSLTVSAGMGLSGGGAVSLGGSVTLTNAGILGIVNGLGLTKTAGQNPTLAIDTNVVPQLGVSNEFTVPQFINGYLDAFPSGNSVAIYGYNTSTDATSPTLYLSNGDSTNAGDLALDVVGPNFGGECSIDVSGNLFCTGTLAEVAKVPNNRRLALYAVQSSESWVEDFGSGQLTGGLAIVNLEDGFAQTVSADADYHVFLTPSGDCEGLYVTNRTATSFEVHELKGGRSSVAFDYRIVVHRKGQENTRLADVTRRFTNNPVVPTQR